MLPENSAELSLQITPNQYYPYLEEFEYLNSKALTVDLKGYSQACTPRTLVTKLELLLPLPLGNKSSSITFVEAWGCKYKVLLDDLNKNNTDTHVD